MRNLFDQVKSTIGFFSPGSGLTLTQENVQGLPVPKSNKSITIIGAGSDGLIEISPLNRIAKTESSSDSSEKEKNPDS